MSEGQKRAVGERLQEEFKTMWAELSSWREGHPEASIDEIVRQVTPRRRALMGEVVVELACQHGSGVSVEGLVCEGCGEPLAYKGEPKRAVIHGEGEAELSRAYYYCDRCEAGLFPPGSATGFGEAQLDAGDD
jgi:hypothetical protein